MHVGLTHLFPRWGLDRLVPARVQGSPGSFYANGLDLMSGLPPEHHTEEVRWCPHDFGKTPPARCDLCLRAEDPQTTRVVPTLWLCCETRGYPPLWDERLRWVRRRLTSNPLPSPRVAPWCLLNQSSVRDDPQLREIETELYVPVPPELRPAW